MLLFHIRTAPQGSPAGQEALEAILAASVFEQPMTVMFEGDGVLQLLAGQAPGELDARDTAAGFSALPYYDVEDIRVHGPSLAQRGLAVEDLILPVRVSDDGEFAEVIDTARQVLGF